MFLKQNIGPNDRIMRIVGGSALAAMGLIKRNTPTGKLLSIMGIGWAAEGLIGHCFYYDLIGMSTKDEA